MRFLYEYRTSDNVKHSGSVNAANKEAAFALIHAQGIRPSRLTEAPGFFNKVFGKGKRWIAIGLLALALVIAILARGRNDAVGMRETLDDMRRRQIIGDSAVVEMGIRSGWSGVFEGEGERFLASFAIPGVPAGVRSTTESEIEAALTRRISATSDDPIEERQIKAMVEGMKDELRAYLRDGGTIVGYGRELVARQERELAYYNRAKCEIESAVKSHVSQEKIEAMWKKCNSELRRMGIRLVAMPD